MRPRSVLLLACGLSVAALGAWYALSRNAGGSAAIPGVVRTTEIKLAPEVSGHLVRVLAAPGQHVAPGAPVALLSNPELFAAVGEARAEVDKAASARDRVYAGVRDEQVQSLRREILKAQAAQTLAHQELDRMTVLAARSDASKQQRDEAQAEAARDDADVAVAEARYAEAQLGPTAEERALADAQLHAAEAARDVVEARAAKMLLRAPAAGTIGVVAPELGEDVIPGETVLTLVPDGGEWLGFNMREDAPGDAPGGDYAIGASVSVSTAGSRFSGRLTELRNWGEFAAWRAARAKGDHDLNTFFVRVDPEQPPPSLSPGQTVWLQPLRRSDRQD
jgi:HlyD family secretion protein